MSNLSRVLTAVGLVCVSSLLVSGSFLFSIPDSQHGDMLQKAPTDTQVRKEPPRPSSLLATTEAPNTIIFVGDVLLGRHVESLMDVHGKNYPFAGLQFSQFSQNPFVVGNFEAAIPVVHTQTENFNMSFSVAAANIPAMTTAGFTHLSLANNHSLDFGAAAFVNTGEVLGINKLSSFGHPTMLTSDSVEILSLAGIDVALIGLHTLFNSPTAQEIEQVLQYAQESSDYQVVYVHWGEEYKTSSNASEQFLAQQLVEAGADLIIGHHPHVVQEVGYIQGVPVFYSLGNYIFDQYFSSGVQTGLLLQLDFATYPKIQLIPVQSHSTLSQPAMLTADAHAAFLDTLSSNSHLDLREYIKQGIIPLRKQVATSSEIAIMMK